MKILENYPENLKKSSLILGFFDGVHLGHREVIMSAVNYAKKNNSISVLLTFKKSPSEYFGKKSELIYPRLYSYAGFEQHRGFIKAWRQGNRYTYRLF